MKARALVAFQAPATGRLDRQDNNNTLLIESPATTLRTTLITTVHAMQALVFWSFCASLERPLITCTRFFQALWTRTHLLSDVELSRIRSFCQLFATMADNADASSEAPYAPSTHSYAVIRMDPVAMVEHLNDEEAMACAKALRPKSYVAYIDCVSTEC